MTETLRKNFVTKEVTKITKVKTLPRVVAMERTVICGSEERHPYQLAREALERPDALSHSKSWLWACILSFPIPSHSILSCLVLSHPVLTYRIPSYPILSLLIVSYPVVTHSIPILSYPISSYPILSSPLLSHPILSPLILSHPILSHSMPSYQATKHFQN